MESFSFSVEYVWLREMIFFPSVVVFKRLTMPVRPIRRQSPGHRLSISSKNSVRVVLGRMKGLGE